MRKFEKISFEQFKKDIKDDKELYESYSLPKEILEILLDMTFLRYSIIH